MDLIQVNETISVAPAYDETICHVMERHETQFTLCGAVATNGPSDHEGDYIFGYCNGCGRPACSVCALKEATDDY